MTNVRERIIDALLLLPGINRQAVDLALEFQREMNIPFAEAVVRKDVEAAGFVFEGSSDVLRNPADPRTALVFDPSIRGKTDQFVLKFRKPK